MAEQASGWDWVGLNLFDGRSLMAFRIRRHPAGDVWRSGNWRDPVGRTTPDEPHFEPLRHWRSPRTGVVYPVAQRIRLASGAALLLQPLLDDQEIDARASTGTLYWEGAVRVFDERAPGAEIGRGYLELTGYGEPIRL
ncbi:MAG: lipocalin family protein [Burkholderiaceae bacterium]